MARTNASVRTSWRNAVSAEHFPVGMRSVKATLLSLPMTPDGRIAVRQDELITATGLPAGTLKRHLVSAVKAGWLVLETRGGNGRPSVYRAASPTSCGPFLSHNPEVVAHSLAHNSPSCGPSGEPLNKDRASVSEHQALDLDVERFPTTVGEAAHAQLFAVPEPSSNGKSAPKSLGAGFDEWYAAYPRHEAKAKALAAYRKALKAGVQSAVLLEGARRYRDDANRSARYTKLPATWLNSGCWDDDPLPPRQHNGSPRTSGPLAVGLTAEHYADDPNDPMYKL